jgi:hypothetical protein
MDTSAELLQGMILDTVKESTPVLQLTTHSKRCWTPQLKISQTQINYAQKRSKTIHLDSDHIKSKLFETNTSGISVPSHHQCRLNISQSYKEQRYLLPSVTPNPGKPTEHHFCHSLT